MVCGCGNVQRNLYVVLVALYLSLKFMSFRVEASFDWDSMWWFCEWNLGH